MDSLLNNIKSTYIFKIFANNVLFVRFLKIIHYNKLIHKKMGITSEHFKKISDVNRIIDPSYEIEKYYKYFQINLENKEKKNSKRKFDINEWILFSCLNTANFNIKLNIFDEKFEKIINNAYKINLIINPEAIYFMERSNNEIKEHIYNLLNKNKNHILEITFSNIELKNRYIVNILDLLNIIFKEKDKNNYIKSNIKNLNFLEIYSGPNIKLFLDEIDNIISLRNISLNFDYTKILTKRIGDVDDYIYKNFSILKSLTLKSKKDMNNYNYESEYNLLSKRIIIFEAFLSIKENNIEILDLSNYILNQSILGVFDVKFSLIHLKELKLKLLKDELKEKINYSDKWNFILKIINTLEVFELSIEEIKLNLNDSQYGFLYTTNRIKRFEFDFSYIRNCYNLISALNKVKHLKKLKLNIKLESEELIKFNNFNNIESLSVILVTFPEFMNEYFLKFPNLKHLEIFNECGNNFDKKKFRLVLPLTVTDLKLRKFDLETINSVLLLNKNKLNLINNFLVEFYDNNKKYFRQLIYYYLLYFKSLKKLSFSGNVENYFSEVLKVVPSLCELNIKMKLDEYYDEFFDDLKKTIPSNIIRITLSSLDENIFLVY